MIGFDEALAAVAAHRPDFGTESVPLVRALGRTLAAAVRAPADSPRFDNSAMDGFAVGSPGCGPWRVVGTVAAGHAHPGRLQPGEAVRIYTGAPLPSGAVAVLAQEQARLTDGDVAPEVPVGLGSHMRLKGEEFRAGSEVLPAGHRLTPPSLSALAATGHAEVVVSSLPRVGLLSTGSELRPPGSDLGEGQIHESNSWAIVAALRGLGCEVEHHWVEDEPAATDRAVNDLAMRHDLLITLGGVSVGGLDLVRDAVRRCGFDPVFEGVAIKPGKPTAFSMRPDGKAWFGLPGNPLSAHTTFCLFVLQYLGSGLVFSSRTVREGFSRKPGREEFLPARVLWDEPAGVTASLPVGSHATNALSLADGLLRVPASLAEVPPGHVLPFAPFPWGWAR